MHTCGPLRSSRARPTPWTSGWTWVPSRPSSFRGSKPSTCLIRPLPGTVTYMNSVYHIPRVQFIFFHARAALLLEQYSCAMCATWCAHVLLLVRRSINPPPQPADVRWRCPPSYVCRTNIVYGVDRMKEQFSNTRVRVYTGVSMIRRSERVFGDRFAEEKVWNYLASNIENIGEALVKSAGFIRPETGLFYFPFRQIRSS